MKIVKRGIENLIKNTKKYINRVKTEHLVREYFKNNVLFITFVITAVLNSTLLRFFCMNTVENYLSWKAILADLTVVTFIGAFGYLFKPKHRFNYYISFNIFLTAICIINSVYYTFYTSFASISMLSLTQYIGDVGDAVVENVLQLKDMVYIISPIILTAVHLKLKKKSYYKKIELKSDRKKKTVKTLTAASAMLILFLVTLTTLDISRFVKQWNKEYIVMRFGIYIYQANDLVISVQPKINSMFGYDKAHKEFTDYFAEEKPISQNQYTNMYAGKNVIVIHAESMMTNAMYQTFNGQEVTPNLNRIARTGLFFSNFYSQVSVGTSSDSELTYNTTLMPTKSGTAFVSYSDRSYISIPKLLGEKGYYTFSMHANNAAFWNRQTMHKSLGYDRFYSKSDYTVEKENIIGLGLSDKEFFNQSIEKLKKINEEHDNWYGLLIMLSNHTPFSDTDKYGEFPVDIVETIINEEGVEEQVTYPYMEGTKLGNYFKSIHYADAALGEFMTSLEQNGLLEDSIVVIYGDHDARLSRKDYEKLYNYDFETKQFIDEDDERYRPYDSYQYELGRKVPFIIWSKDMESKGINKEITNVMGMYDVMPTLGNMLGFHNKYALGNDIFEIGESNIVVFPNGNWINNKMYYNSQKAAYLSLSDQPITEDEITKNSEYANKLLDISNNIIVFDLLNENNDR